MAMKTEKTCERCGKAFEAARRDQKFCCCDCRWRANNTRVREKEREERLETPRPEKSESLEDVARAAAASGMTYGRYVAWMEQRK